MRIAVALKRVAEDIEFGQDAPDAGPRVRARGRSITSPLDVVALEKAVRLRETGPAREVVAITVGTDDSREVLYRALAVGADRGVHVRVPTPGRWTPPGLELDPAQTASILVDVLREDTFELVLFGGKAMDSLGGQVGTLAARRLRVPSVAEVTEIELPECGEARGRVRFEHVVEGRTEVVECPLPAVASAAKGLAEPRTPSLRAIVAARSKPLDTIEAPVPPPVLKVLGVAPAPRRPAGRIVGEGADAVPELVRLLREEAKVIP